MAKGEFGRLPRPPWTCRNAPFVEASLNWRTLDPSNPGGCADPGKGVTPGSIPTRRCVATWRTSWNRPGCRRTPGSFAMDLQEYQHNTWARSRPWGIARRLPVQTSRWIVRLYFLEKRSLFQTGHLEWIPMINGSTLTDHVVKALGGKKRSTLFSLGFLLLLICSAISRTSIKYLSIIMDLIVLFGFVTLAAYALRKLYVYIRLIKTNGN